MNSQIKHHTARLRELLKRLLSPKLYPKLSELPVRKAILVHRNLAQNFTLSLSDTFLLTCALKKKKRKTMTELKLGEKLAFMIRVLLPALCPSSSPYITFSWFERKWRNFFFPTS